MFCIFLFFTNNKILHIIYCSLCVILFGIYLIFDTQLVIGGKKHQIGLVYLFIKKLQNKKNLDF